LAVEASPEAASAEAAAARFRARVSYQNVALAMPKSLRDRTPFRG
jgi:hypothetical protein